MLYSRRDIVCRTQHSATSLYRPYTSRHVEREPKENRGKCRHLWLRRRNCHLMWPSEFPAAFLFTFLIDENVAGHTQRRISQANKMGEM